MFISYSHADSPWLKRVQTMLDPLIGSDRAVVWSDERITPGTKWNAEIKTALVSAKVAVLLASDNFLASTYIKNSELPALLRAADNGRLVLL
ncbi:MAG TPA: toll/interleukin-1 receptor domain-containing protein [Kofleriaceae bacterium]